jgi:hypothetical protein
MLGDRGPRGDFLIARPLASIGEVPNERVYHNPRLVQSFVSKPLFLVPCDVFFRIVRDKRMGGSAFIAKQRMWCEWLRRFLLESQHF